jgi:hypothetical protein
VPGARSSGGLTEGRNRPRMDDEGSGQPRGKTILIRCRAQHTQAPSQRCNAALNCVGGGALRKPGQPSPPAFWWSSCLAPHVACEAATPTS